MKPKINSSISPKGLTRKKKCEFTSSSSVLRNTFMWAAFSKFSIRFTRSTMTAGSVGLLYIPRARNTASDCRQCKSSVNATETSLRSSGMSRRMSVGTGWSFPSGSDECVRKGGKRRVRFSRIATPIASLRPWKMVRIDFLSFTEVI